MIDYAQEFFQRLEKGDFAAAIESIVSHPDVHYDDLTSQEELFPFLENYVDAAVFGSLWTLRLANSILLSQLKFAENLVKNYPQAMSALTFDQTMLEAATMEQDEFLLKAPSLLSPIQQKFFLFEQDGIGLADEDEQHLLAEASPGHRQFFENRIASLKGWNAFKKRKGTLAAIWDEKDKIFIRPWHALRYSLPMPQITLAEDKIPLVFLEPIQGDYSNLLQSLHDRPALFVFETYASFFQMMQFPDVVESLCEQEHLLYILDTYPNEQFLLQDTIVFKNQSFQPVLLVKRKRIEEALPVLTNALNECFNQSDEAFSSDTEIGDWLYHIAKNLLFCIREDRLGYNRAPALIDFQSLVNWYDPHKGLPLQERALGPESTDYFKIRLDRLAKERHKRIYQPVKKIKLTHVVSVVVDAPGHAPSQLLSNLIRHHNSDRFELSLIVTELYQYHPFEYPQKLLSSLPTAERAPLKLALFQSQGVQIHILNPLLTFANTAQVAASLLQKEQTDIAVFHGPDIIHTMCTQQADVPMRILFEHGTQPSYPGFDAAIVSSADAAEVYRQHFKEIETKVEILPFAVDIRSKWQAQPFSKKQLGLPENSQIMTTISNHLGSRLGEGMCRAIAEILKRVPNAYYAPIGDVNPLKQEELKRFFQQYGVAERVVFLGSLDNPSQHARSMTLYLNEFPFGGCLAMLDAMAAGLPIVTMYDTHGPQQARYGGEFVGFDHVVSSGNIEEYIELACRLLTDPQMYKEWSQHVLNQYEMHADVAVYVTKFEAILERLLGK